MFVCFLAAQAALGQTAGSCPGGRVISGFQLTVTAAKTQPLPLATLNTLGPNEELHYTPAQLPHAWQGSARVAVLLVPGANTADASLGVFSGHANKPAVWKVSEPVGAVAFMFGPDGFNAKKTRSLLQTHPELVTRLIQYATQASRVEALVGLLSRYEQSPPGSLNLNAMLAQYAVEYGITMPKVDTHLTANEEAAALLAAVVPPTAQNGPSPHAALTSGSTDTATALASLYFGPEVGIATDTMPLFRALHQSLFPGTQFQGAFAQSSGASMLLCAANTAAPPQHHPVYIWMVNLPGGVTPIVRLARATQATLPVHRETTVLVTCASVAQLRELRRARGWQLTSAAGGTPIPVQVSTSDLTDTLTLDLRHAQLPPGDYHLAARWDWTPITVQGTFVVSAIPSLTAATLVPGSADALVAGRGLVPVGLTGADFAFVNRVELISKHTSDAPARPVAFTPLHPTVSAGHLEVQLDTSKLTPGAYDLRLFQVNGSTQDVPVAVLPPNPTLDQLPLAVNLGEAEQPVVLHGTHLDRIARVVSPAATWKLAPAGAPGATQRDASVTLDSSAQAGQQLAASVFVDGLPHPIAVPDALHVLSARPRIANLERSLAASGAVAMLPGELPLASIVNFTFVLSHVSTAPAVRLGCQDGNAQLQPVELHPGIPSGTQELDAGGGGLYYLAIKPGQIGAPGCQLQMTVTAAGGGVSAPVDLGRLVQLPQIQHFTLSDQSAGPGLYAGELTGDNLQLIAKTGWTPALGVPVTAIPLRSAGTSPHQTLGIAMPWPPPSPHSPLYIWLRGESAARKTTVTP